MSTWNLLHPAWQLWVDTGGTFTDCLALDPGGRWHRAKVLSSSALRARVVGRIDEHTLRYFASWQVPDGFTLGATLVFLERDRQPVPITLCEGLEQRVAIAGRIPADLRTGEAIELRFAEEPPVLAARLLTASARIDDLPPLALRLATTRGTNALLERRGARTVFFTTRGFGDLLRIGNQQRPDLFALRIERPAPLYTTVIEVDERLDAEGKVLRPLELEALQDRCSELLDNGFESAAVAFLHSYRNDAHERQLAEFLRGLGFGHVSISSRLAPSIKILPRAETSVVNAYLAPIIEAYLGQVAGAVKNGSLHVMTSAGGLVQARTFDPKDSLLSGPAGGVVGAVLCARECGDERVIAFDMGGTSTDVARFDGEYEYLYEHRVGDAQVAAPALAIESVAAGGGSVCWHDGAQLKVGPQSAGASPGPACYGAGGPLSVTDVNLLLGRLDPDRFGIPIALEPARQAMTSILAELADVTEALDEEALLNGFLEIANERMADAIRRISVRRGYDPREYGLVAFGGAGGQHACAVASLLQIRRVLMPREAGLLSALGLGAAVIERFAQRQILRGYEEVRDSIETWMGELVEEARNAVSREGVRPAEIEVRRRLLFLRFAGQETTLEIPLTPGMDPLRTFAERYEAVYGYRPQERAIELESLRVVASSRRGRLEMVRTETSTRPARPVGAHRAYLGGEWREVPTYDTHELAAGDQLVGPCLVFDDHATLVVESGWTGWMNSGGTIVLMFD